jgi:hypothetical protein
VDFAVPVSGDDRDLDGLPRDQDVAPRIDRSGVRDLGAYERQSVGDLARNPFFATDLRYWTRVTPVATLQHVPDGAETPGALRIEDDIDAQAGVVIARQCVPLPGPGRYALSGAARVDPTSSPFFARDRASIRWRHVSSPTPNDCGGPTLRSGELQFASTTTFSTPLDSDQGVFDALSSDEFSQVEIQLVVTEGSSSLIDPTAGEFDDVRLLFAGAPSDAIFADSFE